MSLFWKKMKALFLHKKIVKSFTNKDLTTEPLVVGNCYQTFKVTPLNAKKSSNFWNLSCVFFGNNQNNKTNNQYNYFNKSTVLYIACWSITFNHMWCRRFSHSSGGRVGSP
jgi:predicted PolB exonuclease-like 3'-5' exonuclease